MHAISDHISDLREKLRIFLQDQAREKCQNSAPLILGMSYNQKLRVRDVRGEQWAVDEVYFSQYHHIYSDPSYKVVRLVGWHVDLRFKGKKCTKMEIVSTDAEFYSAKEIKRITACHFTFALITAEQELMGFGKEIVGYLNRIGKRQLCNISQNINVQIKSLIRFIPKRERPVEKPYDYHPWKKAAKEITPLQALTPKGLQAFQKIRHFINIDQLIQFTSTASLSAECIDHLKTLIQKTHRDQPLPSRGKSV